MGLRKGTGGGPLIAIAAHLDTVFPEGTDVTVKRDGHAPLGAGHRRRHARRSRCCSRSSARWTRPTIQTASDILFVGNVGEEGSGDLRGMKYLFQKGPYKDRIKMFISIDGAGGGERHHQRRRRQQAVSRDVQGPRRSQLRRLRPRQSGVRDGQRDPEVLEGRRCRRRRRRRSTSAWWAAARR